MEREPLLTERIRQAIDSGKLPARKPDRVLGGLGTGKVCAVCGAMLTLTQMEIEVEFDRGATSPGRDRYWTHPRCYAAWEFELRDRSGAGGGDGTVAPERHALPTCSPDPPLDRGEPRP
jgi:hypothetical protein